MCGIVGVVGKIWKKEEDVFKSLLELDTIRGPHSTGVVSVNWADWEYVKSVGTPWDLYTMKGFTPLMGRCHRALIGHNRWATVGKVCNDNAHPFHHGKFVGVHNGTLRNTTTLPGHKIFSTDSEMIYHSFSQRGIEDTLKILEGAFALAWYNSEEDLVQLCRNDERPLFICKSEDGKTCFFASEPWMLRVALGRHQLNTSEPMPIEPGMLVSLSLDRKETDVILPRVKKVEFYIKPEPPPHRSLMRPSEGVPSFKGGAVIPFRKKEGLPASPSYKDFLGREVLFSVVGEDVINHLTYISCQIEEDPRPEDFTEIRVFTSQNTKLGETLLTSPHYFKAKIKKLTDNEKNGKYFTIDVRSLKEMKSTDIGNILGRLVEQADEFNDRHEKKYVVYGGVEVSLEEWYRQCAKGCSWCSTHATPEEANDMLWFASGQFICKDCKKNPDVNQYMMN